MINVKDYGAMGNGSHDDTQAFIIAINESKKPQAQPVFVPAGTYLISSPLITGDFKGMVGEGKASSILKAIYPANSSTALPCVLNASNMARGVLRDFQIDCDGKANTAIITDWTNLPAGPSLNNHYADIIIVGNYLQNGWSAQENNDCYFERIAIEHSQPAAPSTNYRHALTSSASGGPLQFFNCNFLNELVLAGQMISFTDCVVNGVTILGSGFNIVNFVGTYVFSSNFTGYNIYIAPDRNGNLPTEAGPITFVGSHIEIPDGRYLIGTDIKNNVSGKLHYGINATGCHLFAPPINPTPTPFRNPVAHLVSPNLTSTYYPFAVNKFSNCWFQYIVMDQSVPSTLQPNGAFINQFENCYTDSYYFNEPPYLNLRTGGDVKGNLGLPGQGEDASSRANNRFMDGNGDAANYGVNNIYLQGHNGMGLKDNLGNVKGYIDFRLGKIDLKHGYYIDTKPGLTIDGQGNPNINGLLEYNNNTDAKNALGVGRLYRTGGDVKITFN
jgi:hypothetical protein